MEPSAQGMAQTTTPTTSQTTGESRVFRNSRAFTALVKFIGVAMLACALLFPFVAAWKMIHTAESAGQRTKEGVIILAGCGLVALCGLFLVAQGDCMNFYEARLDPDGLRFRLGSEKAPKVTMFRWDSIVLVNYKMPMNTAYASVVAGDGTKLQWSSYEFFRTKTLAQAIATRAGMELKEMD
jgi:hypothetical protein